MRLVGIRGTSGFKRQPYRFHDVFLGVGNNPFDFIEKFRIDFFKIVIIPKNNLFLRCLCEKFLQVRAKALQDIRQCGNRRGGQIVLKLGDKTFRQLGAVCQFLLSQP